MEENGGRVGGGVGGGEIWWRDLVEAFVEGFGNWWRRSRDLRRPDSRGS